MRMNRVLRKKPSSSNLIEKWNAISCQSTFTVALVVRGASQSYLSPYSARDSLLLSTLCPLSLHHIASAATWLLILLSRCISASATLHQQLSLILATWNCVPPIPATQVVGSEQWLGIWHLFEMEPSGPSPFIRTSSRQKEELREEPAYTMHPFPAALPQPLLTFQAEVLSRVLPHQLHWDERKKEAEREQRNSLFNLSKVATQKTLLPPQQSCFSWDFNLWPAFRMLPTWTRSWVEEEKRREGELTLQVRELLNFWCWVAL